MQSEVVGSSVLRKLASHYSFTDTLEMEECCKAHFSEYYQGSAFDCNVTQLTSGSLLTKTICSPVKDIHLEIFESNQALLYEEEANINSISFCWVTPEKRKGNKYATTMSGYRMNNESVAGFNRISKTGGNTWNLLASNNKLYCMSLRWERLKKRIQSLKAYEAYARLEESIGFDSSNSATVQLKRLVKEHFNGKLITQPAKAFDLAIACLEEGATGNSIERERSESSELVEDLVKLIHEDRNGLSPITLTEISDYLDTGKNSLNKACKQTFGMNVLELTKVVRLEQARKSLSNPTISSGLRLFTKERIAEYYGFSKWTTFEELYFRTYLENPEDTIEKTRDINIGVSALGGEEKI